VDDSPKACVAAFLRREGVARTDPLLVAVSGGADSLALLYLLVALGQRVGAGHVHHGLRGAEADEDLEAAAAHAGSLGVPFHAVRVDAAAPDGRSPEARSRELRYAALERLCVEEGYARVATAHTLDDQAETVLLRAIRGTGTAGLAGIAPRSDERRLLRPLLEVRRQALRAYLHTRGLTWREDSSNGDPGVPRNRIRRSVLPELEAAHPGAARKLAELASVARETESWLREQAEDAARRAVVPGGGGLWLDGAALLGLPAPLLHRSLAHLLERAGLRESVSRIHLLRIASFLAEPEGGRQLSLPQGRLMVRSRRRFWLGPEPGPDASSPPGPPMRREESPD
jgi:tRNA(Ile)-lysidine synthase